MKFYFMINQFLTYHNFLLSPLQWILLSECFLAVNTQLAKSHVLIVIQEQGGEITAEHLERLYIFSLMWSVGALLELEDRYKMEHWLREHETVKLDLPNIPKGSEDTMFDYYVTNNG